jgi:hypothetical protein
MRKSLKSMVARDGVEPPTPAFSGLDTTVAILLIFRSLAPISSFVPTSLLEQ